MRLWVFSNPSVFLCFSSKFNRWFHLSLYIFKCTFSLNILVGTHILFFFFCFLSLIFSYLPKMPLMVLMFLIYLFLVFFFFIFLHFLAVFFLEFISQLVLVRVALYLSLYCKDLFFILFLFDYNCIPLNFRKLKLTRELRRTFPFLLYAKLIRFWMNEWLNGGTYHTMYQACNNFFFFKLLLFFNDRKP